MFGGGPVRRFVVHGTPWLALRGVEPAWWHQRDVGDPHYANLLPHWLTNETYRQLLDERDLRRTITETVRLRPA